MTALAARLLAQPRWLRAVLAVSAGAVAALGHSPYDAPFLSLVALPVIFTLWTAEPRTARLGWLVGLGYFGLALSWIVEPFLVDIARTGWMAPFGLFFLAGGLALFWAAAFALAKRLAPAGVAGVLSLAAALALAEYLRAWGLTGFPWAMPAYIWVETPIAQTAAFVGPHGLGLVTLTLALLPGLLRPRWAIAGVFGLALLWVGGLWRLQAETTQTETQVRLVQPNAPQHLKWDPQWMPEFYRRQREATAAPVPRAPDLVVWPEAAVPFLLDTRPELFAQIGGALQNPQAHVVLGLRRLDGADDWFNSLAAVRADGTTPVRYDKHHLVPFGEYMPLRPLFDAVGLGGFVGTFARGEGAQRLSLPGVPDFQPLICYEAIFPHEILRGATRPVWLLQITNDAWFGTWSGPYQHLAQARMRAIEQGLPLARSANTGVSAMIDPFGRITASLPLGQEGFVDAPLPAALRPTLYARTGDALAVGLIFLWLATALVAARRRG